MNHQELDIHLRKLDCIEKIQFQTNENASNFDDGHKLLIENGSNVPRMQKDYFFDKGPIYINKHHRFANMQVHMHDFIEMNYVYSGECRQLINGQEIKLTKGQICILDKDVPHSIFALGENDILVNIIMKKETFSTAFISRLSNNGILSKFLANAISEKQQHDRYILFHSENNDNLQYIIKNLLCEFFDPKDYSQEMVNCYLPVVFTELMRVYGLDKNFELKHMTAKANIIEILQYIEQHYSECTLTCLAKTFNFNPNYLSNMIKERTGKTFVELLQQQRLIHAATLLSNTDRSINDIAGDIGYESVGFFYRKFKEYFGQTPNRFRENNR